MLTCQKPLAQLLTLMARLPIEGLLQAGEPVLLGFPTMPGASKNFSFQIGAVLFLEARQGDRSLRQRGGCFLKRFLIFFRNSVMAFLQSDVSAGSRSRGWYPRPFRSERRSEFAEHYVPLVYFSRLLVRHHDLSCRCDLTTPNQPELYMA